MTNPKIQPPLVEDGFWVEYSQAAVNINISPFELEEIDRMNEYYGGILDNSIGWCDKGELRARLLQIHRDDLICRTHRSHMLEHVTITLRNVGTK